MSAACSPLAPNPIALADHWPVAVRSAELAHGTLVRCGPGVRLVGWPDGPETRLAALRQVTGPRLVPVMLSAAWVWGCANAPGSPLACTTLGGGRPKHLAATQVQVHEFRYPDSDLWRWDGAAVTSIPRTVCDLLRLSHSMDTELIVAVRLLIQRTAAAGSLLSGMLSSGPGRHRTRALRRLGELGYPT